MNFHDFDNNWPKVNKFLIICRVIISFLDSPKQFLKRKKVNEHFLPGFCVYLLTGVSRYDFPRILWSIYTYDLLFAKCTTYRYLDTRQSKTFMFNTKYIHGGYFSHTVNLRWKDSVVSSVTRCWNKNEPKFYHK